MKRLLCLILLTATHYLAPAQVAVTPGRADTVNYTHVLFELPYNKDADMYEVQLTPLEGKNFVTGRSRSNVVLVQSTGADLSKGDL